MILAAAQTKPKRGDITKNLLEHYRLIENAASHGADLILFPEMSITGYEREDAAQLAFTVEDPRIEYLKKLSCEHQMIIVAGAPVKINTDLFIGSFIFCPDNTVSIYTKQFLYRGESGFFKSSFDNNPIIELGDERISFAICTDIDNPEHVRKASYNRTTLYLASIFFSPNSIPEAHILLKTYARRYSINILMSNFSNESWGQAAGGRSAFWTNESQLIAEMNEFDSGLLIVEKKGDLWFSIKAIDK